MIDGRDNSTRYCPKCEREVLLEKFTLSWFTCNWCQRTIKECTFCKREIDLIREPSYCCIVHRSQVSFYGPYQKQVDDLCKECIDAMEEFGFIK